MLVDLHQDAALEKLQLYQRMDPEICRTQTYQHGWSKILALFAWKVSMLLGLVPLCYVKHFLMLLQSTKIFAQDRWSIVLCQPH